MFEKFTRLASITAVHALSEIFAQGVFYRIFSLVLFFLIFVPDINYDANLFGDSGKDLVGNMHPKTRAKYGAISTLVLKLVATGAITSLTGFSCSPTRINKTLAGVADYGEKWIKKCLVYLRMQGYVKYDSSERYAPLVITKKGLEHYRAKSLMDRLLGLVKKRWDHLWRLVAFDVPERKKNSRDQFREDLQKLGFFPFQKSVYVTPLPCEEEIRSLAIRRRIGKYVLVSVTPNLGWREPYALRWFADDVDFNK